MMGRKRKHNKNLPRRVYIHHKNYRHVAKDGTKTVLAKVGDYGGMLRALAELYGGDRPPMTTMAALIDRYEIEILPTKSESTQSDQAGQLKRLRAVFGQMDPKRLDQPRAIKYRAKRAETAPTAANHEISLLGHICTIAVEWGVMPAHPLKGLRKLPVRRRRRYVSNDEYTHVWTLASPMVRCVMDLAMLTGLRRGDIFRLERKHITNDGLYMKPSKTDYSSGVELLFEMTPALRSVIKQALSLRPQVRQHIVCNRKGKAYTGRGFSSVWGRLMDKATIGENAIERFEFRDLRRKSASDTEALVDAQKRLGHTNPEITQRIYRVLPNKVKPLK